MTDLVLGIETSCDETAAAIYSPTRGLLSNELYSQIALHETYGGVVPELASRAHLEKINLIIQRALDTAKVTLADVDTVAVTTKPGLPGSLLIGTCFAKAVAFGQKKKLIGIDHLEGHAFSPLIEHAVPFPHVALTASGGHTNLMLIKGFGDVELLGTTLDDAAGECFDKVAKLLGLPYPGGPVVERLAAEVGFVDFYRYPRAEITGFDFSFSGLKTAVLYDLAARGWYDMERKTFAHDRADAQEEKKRVCSSLLVCIGDIFKKKIAAALQKHSVAAVTFAGGVACNKYLVAELTKACTIRNVSFYAPSPRLCTDNAGMIAFVGAGYAQQGKFSDWNLDIF